MAILLRLLFAHILSDFVFQNDKICEGKQEKTSKKYVYQLLHSLIHALIAYLFVADWSNWIIPMVIFVSHTLMDYIKVEYMKKDVASFTIDQLVHIAVIVILWLSLFDHCGDFCQELFKTEWNNINIWAVVTAYFLILKPTSVFLNLFIKRWTPSATEEKSLPIFRFGELSKAQEIKTTEYVLIGTLASFTIAIIIGLTVLQIIK